MGVRVPPQVGRFVVDASEANWSDQRQVASNENAAGCATMCAGLWKRCRRRRTETPLPGNAWRPVARCGSLNQKM